MRIVFVYIPALICAGSMFVCVRMMSRGHHDGKPTQSRDEEHVS